MFCSQLVNVGETIYKIDLYHILPRRSRRNKVMANVSFTDDQFRDMMGVLANRNSVKTGSFAACTARYDGTRDATVVEAFLSTISTYKRIESVTDENAIKGLTLLLIKDATTWWLGVKESVTTWNSVITLIRSTFAPKKPANKIYEEIVSEKQETPTGTEIFVAKKRALLAELPKPGHTESQNLDLLYTSLHFSIKDRIPSRLLMSF